MKPETLFWHHYVRPNLQSFGVLHRIENLVELGMPDVVYCLRSGLDDGPAISGWIELKVAPEWPKRPETKFRFRHMTLDQVMWLEEWAKMKGSKCCVVAKVARDFFLIPGSHSRILMDGVTKQELRERAPVYSNKIFPTGRMIRWLTGR